MNSTKLYQLGRAVDRRSQQRHSSSMHLLAGWINSLTRSRRYLKTLIPQSLLRNAFLLLPQRIVNQAQLPGRISQSDANHFASHSVRPAFNFPMTQADAPDRFALITFDISRPPVARVATLRGAQVSSESSWFLTWREPVPNMSSLMSCLPQFGVLLFCQLQRNLS